MSNTHFLKNRREGILLDRFVSANIPNPINTAAEAIKDTEPTKGTGDSTSHILICLFIAPNLRAKFSERRVSLDV